jgi:hypothetical protein
MGIPLPQQAPHVSHNEIIKGIPTIWIFSRKFLTASCGEKNRAPLPVRARLERKSSEKVLFPAPTQLGRPSFPATSRLVRSRSGRPSHPAATGLSLKFYAPAPHPVRSSPSSGTTCAAGQKRPGQPADTLTKTKLRRRRNESRNHRTTEQLA